MVGSEMVVRPFRPCSICRSTAWWWRPASQWGQGEWLCGRCHPNPKKEAEVLEKGHCPHGEFILTEGCLLCIAERQLEEKRTRQEQEGEQLGLEPAPELIGTQLAEEAGIVEAEEEDESYPAPYNASYHAPYNAPYNAPYRLQDGSIVPGVTTVLNVLDKGEGMRYWCWDLGRQGLDYREVRDAAGRVGTLAHRLIAAHLKGVPPDYQQLTYSPEELQKASRCFRKYLAWEKENPLTPVMIETPLVSEVYKYGGTEDLLAEIDGQFSFIDFKTGGNLYESYFCQMAAYWKLLEEQGWPIANARILRISPDENDTLEEKIKTNLDAQWQIFLHCLSIYQLQKRDIANQGIT